MRLALMIEGQEGVTWQDWCALADACEEHGVDTLFRSDHYISQGDEAHNVAHDAWTTIAALAARTSTLALRHARLAGDLPPAGAARERGRRPPTTSRAAGSSSGSAPAGWSASTARTASRSRRRATRVEMLAEQVEIVHRLWTEERVDFHGSALHARGRARAAEAGAAAAAAAARRRQRQARHRRAGARVRRRVQHAVRLTGRGGGESRAKAPGRSASRHDRLPRRRDARGRCASARSELYAPPAARAELRRRGSPPTRSAASSARWTRSSRGSASTSGAGCDRRDAPAPPPHRPRARAADRPRARARARVTVRRVREDPAVDEPGTARLETFSDGVFAIAATLLVLEFSVTLDRRPRPPAARTSGRRTSPT